MKKFLFGMLLTLSAGLFFTACKDSDDVVPTPKNIVQTAQATADLSSLVAALQRAGLVDALSGAGKFTVFAPTNAAFTSFLSAAGFAKLEDVPVPLLKSILLNHVVGSEIKAADVPAAAYVKSISPFGTTTSFISLFVQKDASGVKINKDSKVTTADVSTSNGVVHIVDKVIALPTVVNHALNNPDFSTLVAALTRPGLTPAGQPTYVDILSGAGPFTVFAPNNAAFTALLTELGAPNLAAIDNATLNKVLTYHVVTAGNVVSTTLTNNQVVPTLQGQTFKIVIAGANVSILDSSNRTTKIIATDVQGVNGIIHAVDRVLLPN